jgi:hypothetical protein
MLLKLAVTLHPLNHDITPIASLSELQFIFGAKDAHGHMTWHMATEFHDG